MKCKEYWNSNTLMLFVVWIVQLFLNIWYITTYTLSRNMFNADFAGDVIFAKHLADNNHLIFSLDWYPTTELYIIHNQIIMVPLFKILSDYKLVYILTSIIAYLLVSISMYYMMRSMECSVVRSMVAAIIFLNPIMWTCLWFTVWFQGYLLLGIVSFAAGLCGVRMYLILYAPLWITSFAFLVRHIINKRVEILNRNYYIRLGYSTIASFMGFILYRLYFAPKFGAGSAVDLWKRMNECSGIIANVLSLHNVIINTFFGCLWGNVFKDTGLHIMLKICIGIINLIPFVASLILCVFSKDKKIKVLSLFTCMCIVFSIIACAVVFDNYAFVYSARYYTLSCYMVIPITVIGFRKIKKENTRSLVILIGVITILWALNMHQIVNTYKTDDKDGYIEFLCDNEYTYGVATYWNANTTTFFCNGKVEVAPIINDDNYSFYKWNTQRSFEDMRPEFILLTINEFEEKVEKNLRVGSVLYKDNNFIILDN